MAVLLAVLGILVTTPGGETVAVFTRLPVAEDLMVPLDYVRHRTAGGNAEVRVADAACCAGGETTSAAAPRGRVGHTAERAGNVVDDRGWQSTLLVPLFLTVTVYVTGEPGTSVLTLSVLVIERSGRSRDR